MARAVRHIARSISATSAVSHDVAQVNPTPPPAHSTYSIACLGVGGVNLNGLANLDQTGSYNLAMLGFQGNSNRFNVTQIMPIGAAHYAGQGSGLQANTFLAGANGRAVKSGAASVLNNIVGDGNYVYGYQNGSGNSVALSTLRGSAVNNAVFLVSQSGESGVGSAGNGNNVEWTDHVPAISFEAIQLGDDNTVTGADQGWLLQHCPAHVRTYQTGRGNTITAKCGQRYRELD